MIITRAEQEGIAILECQGRLVMGEDAEQFHDAITAIAVSNQKVVLDMDGVTYIDSTGLGMLVMAHSSLTRQGGAIKIANLNRKGLELLVLTKLSTVIPVFDDRQRAVNSFFPDRRIETFDILSFVQGRKAGGG